MARSTPSRLADRVAARLSGPGVTRRSFLVRTAVVGSALAVAPRRFLLEPVTAYAAVTDVCGPGNECSEGWTVFCCTINNGVNECPSGTSPAGWWRAAGSSWCCGGPRYYIDCHAGCSQPSCSPPSYICDREHQLSPWCQPGSHDFCHDGGTCDRRGVCRNAFRYGNCGSATTCVSSVVCRMVTCVQPGAWMGCSSTGVNDDRTAEQSAPCLQTASWQGGGTPIHPEPFADETSPAVATMRGVSRADVFVRRSNGRIFWSSQPHVDGPWSAWVDLGAPPSEINGSPTACRWSAERIDVFVRGKSDDKLWQRFTENGGTTWSEWIIPPGTQDGTLASNPTAISWAPGRTNIFVVGTDGVVYERFEDRGPGWNHAWLPHGRPPVGIVGHLGAASWGRGHLALFARGSDNKLWCTYHANHAWVGSWFKPAGTEDGTLASSPEGASWGVEQNAVFVRGTDRRLYWTNFHRGAFWGWRPIGRPSDRIESAPRAGSRGCQQLDVFAQGTDDRCLRFRYSG